ncbi:MAG: DUF1152 domain-containing protein [Candidatus Melainabacteria bacterium]|nr:MAG: DUF1152 domain-containing protein [Candidatus Melainabacteria bacterium]
MTAILQPEFLKRLLRCKSILLAGAGGGFDIFCALPLFFALREAGLTVNLASFSFSFRHGNVSGRKFGENLVEVTTRSTGNEYYFPEGYLTKWMARKNINHSIYCFKPGPPPELLESYKLLQKHLEFDCIVLVDGGVDSILCGDESEIGTPLEDMSSLAAIKELDVPEKQLLCLGYSAETDVNNAHALETIAALIKSKAYLGSLGLSLDMAEVKLFAEATEFTFFEMRGYESVICSSVLAALDGNFGDHHRTRRTVGSKLWINPLMMFYWAFDAMKVADSVHYLPQVAEALTIDDVSKAIREYRAKASIREKSEFPLNS